MKMIIATVKPHRFDTVMHALSKDDVLGLTTWEIRGFGRERKDRTEIYRGTTYKTELKPMQLLMVAVTDDLVERTKATIIEHANTGEISTGKIFVLNLEDAVRIRTGESGDIGLL
ncbi:P-II family nitrogen regulator [Candidatus Spongiihabitans sp.]|uniref:P-II family nitrogen regulator n=1 Tax=Candidatus Spongiihabitans sp. TaxID=3101308 RepID=UPI003C7C0166